MTAVVTAAPAAPRPRRWRRRLWRLLLTVLALRLLLALAMPWLVAFGASFAGLDVQYRSGNLSLLGASLQFDDLVVRDAARPDLAPLLRCQQLQADASLSRLLRGAVEVVDVALTGAEIQLSRDAAGAWVLPGAGEPSAAPPAAEPPAPTQPVRWELPVVVRSARVHDLHLLLRDAAAPADAPPLERWLVDVDATDLGVPGRAGSLELRLHDPQRLDHVALRATADLRGDRAAVTLHLQVKGMRLASPLLSALREPFADPATLADADVRGDFAVANGDTAGLLELRGSLQGHLQLDGAPAADLDLSFGPCRHGADTTTMPLTLRCRAPGMFEELALTDATLTLRPAGLAAKATLQAVGVQLQPVREHLRARGVLWPDSFDARLGLACDVTDANGGTRLDATLSDLELGSGEDRVVLPRLAVTGLATNDTAVAIEAIECTGPTAAVRRGAQGELQVAGLRLVAAPDASPAPEATPTAADAPVALSLGTLRWRGLDVRFTDASGPAPVEIAVQDAQADGAGLSFDGTSAAGTLSFAAALPGIADRLSAEVRATPMQGGADAAVTLRSDGTTLARLQPWLHASGARVAWTDASLALQLQASLRRTDGATTGAAALTGLRIDEGDAVLLDLPRAALSHFTADESGLQLGELDLQVQDVQVARLADGTLDVAGLQLPGTAPTQPRQWQLRAQAKVAPKAKGTYTFDGSLQIAAAVARAGVRGEVRLLEDSQQLDAQFDLEGVTGTGIANLLPAGITCTLADGRASATVALRRQPTNGALSVQLTDARLRDGERELAALAELTLRAAELNAERVFVDELRVRGLDAQIATSADGVRAFGLQFGDPGAAANSTPEPTPPATTAAAPNPAPTTLPELRLGALDIDGALTVRDLDDAAATPLQGSVRVALAAPWRTASELGETPPLQLLVSGAATPLLEQVTVDLRVQPFALQPVATVGLRASGIDTTALPRVFPTLAGSVGGTVERAELRANATLVLGLRRRSPTVFDVSRALPLDLRIDDLHLGEPGAAPWLAIAELELDIASFDPRTGDVAVRRIEVLEPSVRLARHATGLEVAGLRLAPEQPTAPAAGERSVAPPPAAADPSFAIELLRVQGLRLHYVDTTTTPATHLPIAALDLDVRHFGSRVLRESAPFSFDLQALGGDIDLERRVVHSSLVAGVLDSAGSAVALGKDEHALVKRPLFDEINLRGNLAVRPLLVGRVTGRVDGFELPGLRGLAAGSGVQIADGVMDFSLDAELNGTAGNVVRALPVFTWLSISEPAGGPISTYLRLPAPLDAVLFLLRNDDGEHRLPARLALDDHALDAASIRDAAVEAVALLIGEALGSTPMRLITSVTSVFGLGGKTDLGALAREVPFAAGQTTPPPVDVDAIVDTLTSEPERRVVLRHEPSPADRERMGERTTPPAAVVHQTVADLRGRRTALLRERDELAARLAADLLGGRATQTFAAQARFEATSRRLADLEDTLDAALAMLEEGHGHGGNRRIREALRDLGEARMAAVRRLLLERLGPDAARRIEQRSPRAVPTPGLQAGGRVLLTVR